MKQLNFVNIKDYGGRMKYYSNYAFINKSGRLFGVTDLNDAYLIIKVADDNGRKIIAVEKSSSSDNRAVKSSAPSTGKPFINMQSVCKQWYGDDANNWKHTLSLLESKDGVDYYEVLSNENRINYV